MWEGSNKNNDQFALLLIDVKIRIKTEMYTDENGHDCDGSKQWNDSVMTF